MAVVAPIAWAPLVAPAQATQPDSRNPASNQEESVKKAIERRDQQLAPMRHRALPYDLEPAFVFAAWTRPRAAPKS
jgi:hypothetical protein